MPLFVPRRWARGSHPICNHDCMLKKNPMTDPKTQHPEVPDPATEALDEPHLPAEDLEQEIGDSETWDEASERTAG
jgi:hypothetical protein